MERERCSETERRSVPERNGNGNGFSKLVGERFGNEKEMSKVFRKTFQIIAVLKKGNGNAISNGGKGEQKWRVG